MSSAQSKAAPPPARSRILALDYGRRRIGLALSDDLHLTVRPLQTMTRSNRRNDLRRLREIARENSVGLLVVGHPLGLDGSAGEMADEAAAFAVRLRKELGLPVELADERLTSWEAEQMAAAAGQVRSKARSTDEVAAAIILRDYLKCHRTAGKGQPHR